MTVYLVERRFEYDVTWHVTAAYQTQKDADAYVAEAASHFHDPSDAYRISSVYVLLASGE